MIPYGQEDVQERGDEFVCLDKIFIPRQTCQMNLAWQNADAIKEYIPLEQCKDGWLYRIAARNATLGIYRADKQYFEIRRQKGNEIYRFSGEYHWDWQGGEMWFGNKMLGTAKPIVEIEETPTFGSEKEFIEYMEKKFDILQNKN